MKFVPNAISNKVARQALVVQKNSPTILFGAGIIGVVATAVLASKATLKLEGFVDNTERNLSAAKMLKEQERADYTELDYNRDVTYIYIKSAIEIGRLYAPAIAVGALSITALTSSHRILTKRNVALTAAYGVLDKTFKDYRGRVIDELGEDKERDIRFPKETREVSTEGKDGSLKIKKVKEFGPNSISGYARYFDEGSRNWNREHEYNLTFLRIQQNYANDILQSKGHIFLNEVYDMLDIPRTKAGQVVGWVIGKDGDNYVDFGIFNENSPGARDFVNGREGVILLDFNVDGVIYDKI